MRLPLAVLMLSAALGACGGSQPPAVPGAAAAGKPMQLRREGRWLVDPQGRVVLTHGMNLVWKLAPYAPPAEAKGFVAADADWLARHGFNSARIGTLFAGVMPEPGRIDAAYLERWDRVVQLLAARGIYTLFDFHQDLYNERYGGEGFPDWATDDDGLPMPFSLGFPGNYFTPACSRAFDNFWDNKNGIWDHYRDAWKAVAARWKDQGYQMGYDLINEPWPGTDVYTCMNPAGCPVHDDRKLQSFQEHVLAGIRQVDPGNVVWLEPHVIFNSGAKTNLGLLRPVADANLGLSWHKYCLPAALLHSQGAQDVPACEQYHQIVNDNAEEAVQRLQSATLITEFGASDDLADLEQVTRQADSQLTGWQYWHYKEWGDPTTESQESGGQGLFRDDADLASVKLDKLRVLERTYPQATAGIPLELSFDPADGEFFYRYQPRPAAAPTEIYVPVALHYPKGYTAEVQGAQVRSAADAPLLLLENVAGATEVTVRVRAR
ncbi:MAG: cellulase family glycosylhydrolase [Gammaproteobacteria bacterium]|nr:cellulase family glycosylhydrolase [Gammaproteobacteria bacterium]